MKTLFEPKYDMIVELDKLERLMPSYAEPLSYLSKVIRNKVWDKSETSLLAKFLNISNWIYSILVEVAGEDISVIEMYTQLLERKSSKYSRYDLSRMYQEVQAHTAVYKTQVLMKEHWKQINPYFSKDFVDDDLFEKNILDLLDDLFANTIDVFPEEFYVQLSNIKCLCRGRRGEWHTLDDLLPPSIEIAKEYCIINRWNPPDKRYLYLAVSQKDSILSSGFYQNEYVCCEEMRLLSGEEVTLSKFSIVPLAENKKVINLAYDDITREDIFEYVNRYEKEQVNEIVSNMIENRIPLSEATVRDQIDKQSDHTKKIVSVFCGKLFLKELCAAIFTPLDDSEDKDSTLKDKCYKAFHIMAEYFEQRNIAGIIYPSTRMKLINEKGTNLVVFDVDDARPILSSLHTLIKP